MWFVAAAGAAADRLQPAQLSTGQDPGTPVALADADTGTLVVVSAPGDVVAVSPRPDVAADGTVSRQWQRVDAPDGVAVLALPPAAGTYDEALRYRVTRGGAEVVTAMPAGHRAGDRPVPGVPLDWLRGGPGSPAAAAVLTGGIDHVLELTGLPPDLVRFRVVWAGDVPAAAGRAGRLQLLSATLPSGAVYLEALLGPDTGGAGATAGTWCGADLRPAGPSLSDQLFVLACSGLSGGGSEPTDQLVLVGPPAATTARLLNGNGTELARTPLTDGVGVLRAPGDLSVVEFLAGERTSLGSAQPLGYGGLADLTGTGGD